MLKLRPKKEPSQIHCDHLQCWIRYQSPSSHLRFVPRSFRRGERVRWDLRSVLVLPLGGGWSWTSLSKSVLLLSRNSFQVSHSSSALASSSPCLMRPVVYRHARVRRMLKWECHLHLRSLPPGPPVEAHFDFWMCQFCLPLILETVWAFFPLFPWAWVPFVYSHEANVNDCSANAAAKDHQIATTFTYH